MTIALAQNVEPSYRNTPRKDFIQTYLSISSMKSKACAARIEAALNQIEGVVAVTVKYESAQSSVIYSPLLTNANQIMAVISKLGYKVSVQEIREEVEAPAETYLTERFKQRRLKFATGLSLTIPLLIINLAGLDFPFYRWIMLLLASPVVFWCGSDFFTGARQAFQRPERADMNTLTALGIGSAFVYSAIVTVLPGMLAQSLLKVYVYFDTAALITVMLLLGRMLEERARRRTSETIRGLLQAQTPTARVIKEKHPVEVSMDDVEIGDIVVVRPGERVPVDGIIVSGNGTLDESLLTGESLPIDKESGDKVYAGTLNKAGAFSCKVLQKVETTTLRQIVQRLRQAQSTRLPLARLADIASAYFVYAIILLAVITFGAWVFFAASAGIVTGFVAFASVLIIACPCALGLATPTAAIVGMGKSAELGVLFRNGSSLERTSRLSTVLLDKTGTITAGSPSVATILPNEGFSEDQLLRFAASAEQNSEHPIAKALLGAADTQGVQLLEINDFEAFAGFGLKVKIIHGELIVGNTAIMRQHGISITGFQRKAELIASEGKTVVFVALNYKLAGLIGVSDQPKIDSYPAIHTLRSLGLKVLMLTGDAEETAKEIGYRVRVRDVVANVMPDDKVAQIQQLQKEGEFVGMVGDGVNDAPAIAQADVGFAMGSGADITIEAGDVTLIHNDLKGVVRAVVLARQTIKVIRQNLFLAFFFNVVTLPVAAGALYPLCNCSLTPLTAGAVMSFSSLLVLGNSLLLRRFNIPKIEGAKLEVSYLFR